LSQLLLGSEMCVKVGIIIPVVGIPIQEYLFDIYDGLAPLERKVVGFWRRKDGWVPDSRDLVVIASSSIRDRLLNKIYRMTSKFSREAQERHTYVPPLPLEWRRRFRGCVTEGDLDVLLIMYGGTGVAILDELEHLKIPVVVNFGGSDSQIGDNVRWYAEGLQRLWQRADKCVFISEFLRQQACSRGCPAEKSEVIYRGKQVCEKPSSARSNSEVRFICAASMLPVKGHRYLIEAFRLAKEKSGAIELWLIGEGPLMRDFKSLVNKLGLSGSVKFLGMLSPADVRNLMLDSDVYVQASVRAPDGAEEGLGNAVLEAQACGLPAIVFGSGALSEVVCDHISGFIVPEQNIEAMADAMVTLAGDTGLRGNMSEAAHQNIMEKFNLSTINKMWRETLCDVVRSHRKP